MRIKGKKEERRKRLEMQSLQQKRLNRIKEVRNQEREWNRKLRREFAKHFEISKQEITKEIQMQWQENQQQKIKELKNIYQNIQSSMGQGIVFFC